MSYLTACMSCKKLKIGDEWVEYKVIFIRKFSHGLCPLCYQNYMDAIEVNQAKRLEAVKKS